MPATPTESKPRWVSVEIDFGSPQTNCGACPALCDVGSLLKHEGCIDALHLCARVGSLGKHRIPAGRTARCGCLAISVPEFVLATSPSAGPRAQASGAGHRAGPEENSRAPHPRRIPHGRRCNERSPFWNLRPEKPKFYIGNLMNSLCGNVRTKGHHFGPLLRGSK